MHPALADIELPESVQQALDDARQGEDEAYQAQLDAIGKVLLDKRKEAIDGRKKSGIEDVWKYCEEAYLGMDNANRHEFNAATKWYKPLSVDGGLSQDHKRDDTKSCIFIPFTRRYTNAGVAKVQELLLAPDERPFGMEPTPVPELVKQLQNTDQVKENGVPLERDPTPKELDPGTGGTPENPLPLQPGSDADASQAPGKPLTYADIAAEKMQHAVECAEAAAKRIHDQMVEGRFIVKDRRCIADGGRLGTGVLKGPIPDISRTVVAYKQKDPATGQETNVTVVEVKEDITPVVECVSVKNLFPDPGCGEDIQDGEYIWERADLSRSRLQRKAKMPGYSKRAIAKILSQPPKRIDDDTNHPTENQIEKQPYQGWYFYGTLTQQEFQLIQQDLNNPVPLGADQDDDQLHDVFVQGTIVNDEIIQMVQQPNEKTGKYPYHTFKWLDREGHWTGIGIPEQGMPAQRIINAATRRLIDNAGYSAGMQLIVDMDQIEPVPVDGERNDWKIQAIKLWRRKAGTMIDDIRKAFTVVQLPNAQAQLSWLIEYGIKLYEETTNIPLVTQGWSGKTTPDTLGATELQDSNANQMLRDVAINHDQGIIVPCVTQHYEWHMLDDSVPFEEKGDLKIFARGSTVLLDRYLQRQVYEKFSPMLLQGQRMFGINPMKLIEEMWRGYRLNIKAIQYTPTELQNLEKQPPPEPPEVTVAKMRAQVEMEKAKMQHEYNMQELQIRQQIAQFDYQAKLLGYSNDRQISLEDAKKELAKTSMELSVQQNISLQTQHAKQVMTPPTEPAGRAPNGEAFQR